MSKAKHHANISYRRSKRAKNMRITISPDAAVTVTVPGRVAMAEAQGFVRSRQGWIQKHLAQIQKRQEQTERHPELSREQLNAAQEDLFDRLAAFSEQFDLPYNKAAFRCQKTKWGSCSSADNISLNINLAFLPTHLQDYILLHELCHVRHKNHGKHFWTLLDQLCGGNAKQYAKQLRGHGMKIRP